MKVRVTVPADREFVAVEDPLPAGLEPIDLRLRTSSTLAPFVTTAKQEPQRNGPSWQSWLYGSWDDGWWSEMYNPALQGRSDGRRFRVEAMTPRD